MRAQPSLLAALALGVGGATTIGEQTAKACPCAFDVQGIGSVSLVPTGWATPENMTYPSVRSGVVSAPLNSRAYFASDCTPGVYDNDQYLALDLRGKTLVYTTDMSGAGCGCNAAFYLTPMCQNERASECGDHYCDANNVCGESCAEIDIQEGNKFAWHSTLHDSGDPSGLGKGYGGGGSGWNGPRDFGSAEFGPEGRCVDTNLPFEVSVYFRVDDQKRLQAMEITLTQHGRNCPLWISIGEYGGMGKLDAALAGGVTPIVSYWSSGDLQWMDGKGDDGQGPCFEDRPTDCGEAVRFYNFSVTPAFPATTPTTTMPPTPKPFGILVPWEPSPESSAERRPAAGGRIAGALAILGVSIAVAVLVWLATATRTPRGRQVCESVSASVSPLKRAVQGSAQSLLLLAESGEHPPAARAPAAQEPSREGTEGP